MGFPRVIGDGPGVIQDLGDAALFSPRERG